MPVEPVTPTTPRPVRVPLLSQWWRHLTFLHWPVAPDDVAPLLPPDTVPDTLDGRTYVGLVAFLMDRVGPFAGPGLAYLGRFCETNVRLYTRDAAGRRGVAFRSLDAARLLPALVGRTAVGLPYTWARMSLHHEPGLVDYRSRRRWPRPRGTSSHIRVAVGEPIGTPTELELFLTARWGLHVSRHGRTRYLPNDHPQWPLHTAELLHCDGNLIRAASLPQPTGAPVSVLYSPGVPVRFGLPRRATVDR
jgi:uncharacterized protein